MKRQGGGVEEILVEEEMDVAAGVVDEAEGRHAAWFKTKIASHALG